MALSASGLSAIIKANLRPSANVTNDAEFNNFCDAIAQAIVTHLTGAAEVTGTVQSGNGAGGSIKGTLT